MKKKIAMLAVLSTAAAMSAVTPSFFTADRTSVVMAASAGWGEEADRGRYVDSDGDYVTDSWKKRDGVMYYLDETGEVATGMIIDDEYYVDENGKRVENYWLSVYNEENMDSLDAPEYLWYYFGRDGRSVKSKWAKIEGNWYYFNSDGHMLTGKQEIDGHTYYLGAEGDGVRKSGWVRLEEDSDDPDQTGFWYFFDSNGRMIENQIDKKIDGSYYTFVDGKMQTGWFKLPQEENTASSSDAAFAPKEGTIHGYQYYEADGKRASGWYDIEGAEGISAEDETFRFYFRNGKPLAAETGIQVFTVDSKRFAFNERGEMQTGMQVITLEDGSTANAYFGDDGVMRTGKQTIYNEELDEKQVWYFHTDGANKGQGYHGIRDNSIYVNGLRQDAEKDLKTAPVVFEGTTYLVNSSGAIQKASASSQSSLKPELGKGFKDVKDANDKIWIVDVNGVVQQ